VRRLTLYRLRAKVDIAAATTPVAVVWDDANAPEEKPVLTDGRFKGAVFRRYDPPLPAADSAPADWDAYRIGHGIAESGPDYALGDAFPHDVLLDQIGGVGFKKGCYVGQEVVSRMQHRGTARRRLALVTADEALPASGTEITAGGKAIGTLGTVLGSDGLAIVRTDRAGSAVDAGTPVTAGDVTVRLSLPEWTGLQMTAGEDA
jgi:folate-binding protein YgfZ